MGIGYAAAACEERRPRCHANFAAAPVLGSPSHAHSWRAGNMEIITIFTKSFPDTRSLGASQVVARRARGTMHRHSRHLSPVKGFDLTLTIISAHHT